MLRARPIPQKLLIHEIKYSEVIDGGRYGGESFAEPITIRYVRVAFSSEIIKSGDSVDEIASATVYLDARNTKPFMELKKGSKIEFAGKSYTVNTVSPVSDIALHHYKVGIS